MEDNNQNSDLTEQEQTIQKLKESEKKYREILDNLDQGYYEVDLKGKYTFVNKFQANYLGLSKEELIGTNYGLFYNKEEEKRVFEKFNEVYKKNLLKGLIEVETRGPNGLKRTFEASIYLKNDSNGNKIGFYGTVYDISERKKLELELAALNKELEQKINIRTKKLSESEEKWRSLAKNAPNIIIIVDPEGNIQFLNRSATGIDVKEVVGSNIYDYIQPEYYDIVKRTIKRVLDTGEHGSYDVRGVGPHGRISWYDTQVGPITQGNKIVNVMLITTDITERKQAEQELKEKNFELSVLNRIITLGSESQSLQEFLKKSYDQVLDIVGFDRGGVYLYNPETQHNILILNKNVHPDFITAVKDVDLSKGIFKMVFDKIKPFYIEDFSEFMENSKEMGVHSAVIIPLRSKDEYIGSLNIGSPVHRVLSNHEIELLVAIGKQMGIIIQKFESEQLLKESEEKYRKAYNRAEFYKDLFAHDISNILQHILSATELSDLLINNGT